MRIWKIFCLGFVSLLLALLPAQTGSTCGIGGRAEKTYSFIETEAIHVESDYAPFLLSQGYDSLADYYSHKLNPQVKDNVAEWRGRFCNIPDSVDIAGILYHASVEDLADLRQAAKNKRPDIFYASQKNTFAQVLKENRCIETIDYLLFAKRCEPFAVRGNQWVKRTMDSSMMYVLMKQGRDLFRETSSPFLKLRYLYQVIRLAHYAKDYPAVLRAYDEMVPKMDKVNSIINYWVMGHRAGALLKLGRRVEAAYLYSIIFCYCPSKREQAFRSFDIRTESEWRQCLNMCRTDRERATLYAIRASGPETRALDDMVEMYRIYPGSEELELLLIRETQKVEKVLLGKDFRRPKYPLSVREKSGKYLLELRAFVHDCADEGRVRTPALWRATEGYQTLLAGDYYNARKILDVARSVAKDDLLKRQIGIFDLAAKIAGLTSAGMESDTTMRAIRSSEAYASDEDFDDYFHERVGALYKKANSPGVAFLCDYSLGDLVLNPNLQTIEELIALCRKPDKTDFERELITKSGTKTLENDLLDLKGTLLFSQYQLEAAADAFRQISATDRKNQFQTYNPFTDKINDCVSCHPLDTISLDKLELVQKILDLEYQAKANIYDPAPFYYQIGLAYYNMTYFGNSYKAMDFFRSGATWSKMNQGGNVFPKQGKGLGNRENIDCTVPLRYFELARQLTRDPELAAKAAFMGAKCEQNIFFTSKENRYVVGSKLAPYVPPEYRQYYGYLRTYYANTNYYKQVVRECKYFRYYSLK